MPFKIPTTATRGSMALYHTVIGRPSTNFKIRVNTPPLTKVEQKPVIKGRSFQFSRPLIHIAFTNRQQVVAPNSSLAIFPRGKALLEEGTRVRPAIKPMPRACFNEGLVKLMTMEYMAMVQLGVTPPTLGLTVCKMMPIASSMAVMATHLYPSWVGAILIS